MPAPPLLWLVSILIIAGLIVRPFRLPEAVWPVAGAVLLLAFGLVTPSDAFHALAGGLNVYLFLLGMMILAELGREEGVFAWLAAFAAVRARGSQTRLFTLIFVVATVVTILLSNDATVLVLTPAVFAVAQAVEADPLPYLFLCAFVANAASFVLPISNPTNLIASNDHLPGLGPWLARFGLASVVALVATYYLLRWTQRRALRAPLAATHPGARLSRTGRVALAGIALAALAILTASAIHARLGWPTFAAAAATTVVVLTLREGPAGADGVPGPAERQAGGAAAERRSGARQAPRQSTSRRAPWLLLRKLSWSVLALVAGLFVWVQGLVRYGLIAALSHALAAASHSGTAASAVVAGSVTALASNAINNLPVAMIVGSSAGAVALVPHVATLTTAMLIGVDLGPNLSVTGSLATLIWIAALRRDGVEISGWRFLRLGFVIMFPALAAALAVVALHA